jgi:hypothetical protein
MFTGLLDQAGDLSGVLVTADALCRHRHKASYAEPVVMPISARSALAG